jgi:hypothetical protein
MLELNKIGIPTDAEGLFQVTRVIDGYNVVIQGRIIGDILKYGTMYIPK